MNRQFVFLASFLYANLLCLWFVPTVCLSNGTEEKSGQTWTRFRGPNGSGISRATTVPTEWTEDDYNWKTALPGVGMSSPVIWKDRVFLTSANRETAERHVLCLDTTDGQVVWQRDYASETYRQHGSNCYASATPAVDARGVVVAWTTPKQVTLLALDHDGDEMWRKDLGPYVGGRGSGISPIIVDDLVIMANDQEDPNLLPENWGREEPVRPVGVSFAVAIDRTSGKTRWITPRTSGIGPYATPCVYRPEGGPAQLILNSMSHGISGLELATGKLLWEVPDALDERIVASPVIAKGASGKDVILGTYGRGIVGTACVAVRPGTENTKAEIVYTIEKSIPIVSTPLVKDDRLYLWSDDGIVTCVEAASGTAIWRKRVGGSYYGSPICVDNRLYGVARDGEVVVLAAADEFQELARVPLGEPSHATPAVADGVMYLRTHGQLFSLGGERE